MSNRTSPGQLALDFSTPAYGLCRCGCGSRTTIAPRNDTALGYVKGEPRQYIRFHANAIRRVHVDPAAVGAPCACGCGGTTKVARYSDPHKGTIAGQPMKCIGNHKPTRPLEDRFWEKVLKTPTCWLWHASKRWGGYGVIGSGRRHSHKQLGAHHVSWMIHRGTIPDGFYVLHNCPGGDNPACVNPEHLWLGTQADNMRDMVAKGRAGCHTKPHLVTRGTKSGMAILHERDIPAIRARLATGEPCESIGASFHVCGGTISNIKLGRTWCHVP